METAGPSGGPGAHRTVPALRGKYVSWNTEGGLARSRCSVNECCLPERFSGSRGLGGV